MPSNLIQKKFKKGRWGKGRRGKGADSSEVTGQLEVPKRRDVSGFSLFRSCVEPDDEGSEPGGVGTKHLSRAPSSSALSELLDGLRRRRAADASDGGGSTVSLPIYQTTGASTLRRRSSALSLGGEDVQEPCPRPSILKPPSPLLPRAATSRSNGEAEGPAAGAKPPLFSSGESPSSLPALPRLSSLSSSLVSRCPPSLSIPEEDSEDSTRSTLTPPQRSPQALRYRKPLPADEGEGPLGSEPLVFRNRRLTGDRDDAASDILPAIRRSQSTSSLASSVRGGRRALSVHFGELPPSTRSRRSSDTESSSSGSSHGGGPRGRGETPQGERLEAEGSEGGDVASVMRKYLKKESD